MHVKYELSMGNIKVSVQDQSMLIVVNVRPCMNHLLLLADIHETDKTSILIDKSGIIVSQTPVNKVQNIYRSRKTQNCRKPK